MTGGPLYPTRAPNQGPPSLHRACTAAPRVAAKGGKPSRPDQAAPKQSHKKRGATARQRRQRSPQLPLNARHSSAGPQVSSQSPPLSVECRSSPLCSKLGQHSAQARGQRGYYQQAALSEPGAGPAHSGGLHPKRPPKDPLETAHRESRFGRLKSIFRLPAFMSGTPLSREASTVGRSPAQPAPHLYPAGVPAAEQRQQTGAPQQTRGHPSHGALPTPPGQEKWTSKALSPTEPHEVTAILPPG
ncbi:hypothetical protein NDU88_001016 [Pleurodeles waltl]|uniref:Uncharacterized protein n=1 Tax=Pleurodeles waltl TaxID=8319 RepID=A0AAV7R7S6_PLEWA|nr:hypothetical protein NDU88_001016 [Pleurodeles waltl]